MHVWPENVCMCVQLRPEGPHAPGELLFRVGWREDGMDDLL